MATNEYLHDRTDFGFQLLSIRNAAARANEKANFILSEVPAGDEGSLGPEALLKMGWMFGSLMTSIKTLARRIDERCPDLQPSVSKRVGNMEFELQATARETIEAAEAILANAVEVLDYVNRHLISEIDEEIPVSAGPEDDAIQAWLAGGVVEPQP